MEYLIKQYALEPGAWEIQYIEEYFGEFPRRKTADEIITRLRDRESLILMAEAPLPDDPSGALVPVSYKIVHEIRADESIPKLRDLVTRLRRRGEFRRPPHSLSWIGGTRRDWRGQGHFRALTEESEVWAMRAGFEEVVVKAKNRYYDMRAVLASAAIQRRQARAARDATSSESKIYLSKLLPAEARARPPQHPHRRLRRVAGRTTVQA